MCGNGARCVALFAFKNRIAKRRMRFETKAGLIQAEIKDASIKVGLSKPKGTKLDLVIRTPKDEYFVHFINTGVPHVVMFKEDLDKIDVNASGRIIRFHRVFSPAGTNVNFAQIGAGNRIKIRTYERGVEGETYACGTGSVASAIISAKVKHLKPPVEVLTKSGEALKVYFDMKEKDVDNVFLEGKAKEVFEGLILL